MFAPAALLEYKLACLGIYLLNGNTLKEQIYVVQKVTPCGLPL